MKLTKSSIAIAAAAALFAFSGAVQAQPTGANTNSSPTNRTAPPPRFNPESRLQSLSKTLDLTDEQKPKVKAVLEEETKAMQEARSTMANATVEERRAKVKSIQDETSAKMKAILTPEQYTKYEALPKRGGQRRPAQPGNPGGANEKK